MLKTIVLGEFKQETNRFAPVTGEADFRSCTDLLGEELYAKFRGIKMEMSGFLDVLEGVEGIRLVPAVAMEATPGGPVADGAFERFCRSLLDAIRREGRVDGVLLALHGAMVTESLEDGEGEVLSRVRELVTNEVPVIASLDLHANVTEKMIASATALVAYREYPHTDMYDCGVSAAKLMLDAVTKGDRFTVACCQLPLLVPYLTTTLPELAGFNRLAKEMEKEPGVRSVSICQGFFSADIKEAGVSVIAVTEGDRALAQNVADRLGGIIWQARERLKLDLLDIDGAIDHFVAAGESERPMVFADMSDNPGAGGSCDTTHIVRRLLERGIQNAAVAIIHDPQSVEAAVRAGVGQTVELELGGKGDPSVSGGPLRLRAYVRAITDGCFRNRDTMSRGFPVRMGPTAVLEVSGIEIIVTTYRIQPLDLEVFRSCGIHPEEKALLVVKSMVHYRASYGTVAKQMISVVCPGLSPPTPELAQFRHLSRPVYPLNNL